jgi:hypothetical protein
MEETQTRLKESAEACITAYDVWGSSKKNAEARERLQEAVHELRKVAARLEIEMASSERDEMTQRPIAVPPHRASRPRHAEIGNELPDFITDGNQNNDDDGQQPAQNQSRPIRAHTGGGPRRPHSGGPRRPHSGGGQGNNNQE